MRKFYIEYPDVQSLTGHLSWTHICELLIIEDKSKCGGFYPTLCIATNRYFQFYSIRLLSHSLNS